VSIFASRSLKVVSIPFDEGQTVTIQKLPGRHLATAQEAKQLAARAYVERMGGDAFRKELAALGDAAPAAVAQAQADPLNMYDRLTLLQKGIKAWTYVDEAGTPVPVTEAAIDDLSDEAAAFLAREILQLTKPALFQTAEEQATEKKIAPDSSTAP